MSLENSDPVPGTNLLDPVPLYWLFFQEKTSFHAELCKTSHKVFSNSSYLLEDLIKVIKSFSKCDKYVNTFTHVIPLVTSDKDITIKGCTGFWLGRLIKKNILWMFPAFTHDEAIFYKRMRIFNCNASDARAPHMKIILLWAIILTIHVINSTLPLLAGSVYLLKSDARAPEMIIIWWWPFYLHVINSTLPLMAGSVSLLKGDARAPDMIIILWWTFYTYMWLIARCHCWLGRCRYWRVTPGPPTW
jgi:hypothetical protein